MTILLHQPQTYHACISSLDDICFFNDVGLVYLSKQWRQNHRHGWFDRSLCFMVWKVKSSKRHELDHQRKVRVEISSCRKRGYPLAKINRGALHQGLQALAAKSQVEQQLQDALNQHPSWRVCCWCWFVQLRVSRNGGCTSDLCLFLVDASSCKSLIIC